MSDVDYSQELDIVADELIDTYVTGTMPHSELTPFKEYFLNSRTRRDALEFARVLKRRKAELRRSRLYRIYRPAAAAVLVLGVAVFVWLTFRDQSDVNKGLAALHSAYQNQRPLEARLTDFGYAPVLRGGEEKVDYVQRDLAASLLLSEVPKKPSATGHRALGQYYLALRQFDKAVDQLRTALKLDPEDAKAQADLGAALLEIGKLNSAKAGDQGAVQAFAESLEHLNKALDLNSSLNEALFNRALLYQYMKSPSMAEQDWRTYLARDPNSPWADEARRNLQMLEEQRKNTSQNKSQVLHQFQAAYEAGDEVTTWKVASSYHNRTGNVVFEQALDSYIDSVVADRNDRAVDSRRLLSYLGELERRQAGDNFFFELTDFYAAASKDRLVALQRARSQMKAAHDGWGRFAVSDSLKQFSEARELFEKAADNWEAIFAGYWISFCLYQQHDSKQGLALLEPLLTTAESKDYSWLAVRMLYLSSILQFDQTNYSRAVQLAEQSLAIAEKTSDAVGQLNGLTSMIEYYRYLSQFDKSLSYIQRSLPLLGVTTLDPIQGCRHYGFVATSLASAGWYDAAAAYQKEALQYAFTTTLPATISINLAFLSQIESRRKRFDEAANAAERAFQVAEANGDDRASRDRMAYASLQLGHVHRQTGSCDKAIENYDRAIKLYNELNYQTQVYQGYKGRLLCYLAQGNDSLAKQEISTALGLAESYRDKIFEPSNRQTFFDAEQSVYDLAIDFYYSKLKSPEEAFYYSELSRGRSLLKLAHSADHSLSTDEIKQRLPDEAQLVQFAMLSDRLIIWVFSSNQVSHVPISISGDDLQEKVRDYLQLISSNSTDRSDEIASQARELHDLLIKPIEPLLDKKKQLCIVADKVLNLLPFSSLISRESGRYLLDDYVLTSSPSATMLVLANKGATERQQVKGERILSVGNPRFDRDAYPLLLELPAAAWEAAKVAALYFPRRVLVNDEASAQAVLKEMPGADVIHLALHSISDEQVPEHSRFLFAHSVLSAADIYALPLSHTRLAVLSACNTGSGRYFGGEGIMNMAHPFLAAGVPLVVASLWPVESESAAKLMVDFHRLRTQSRFTSAHALQQAQLAMLHDPDKRLHQPHYWASFVLIGGYAKF